MTNAAPRVSVVLPVYNAASTLPACLASLRAQSLREWELIAVDDGSTDGSGELLRTAGAGDARVRVWHPPHRGVVAAANQAHAAARAPIIARMDADDSMHPDRLARQCAYLEAHPAIDFVASAVEFGGDAVAQAGFSAHVDWLNGIHSPQEHALYQFCEYPLANPSLCGRREAWQAVGPYREGDLPEDYEWFLRAMEQGHRFAKIPAPLLTWNDLPTRLTRTDPRYAPGAFLAVKLPFLERWLRRAVAPGRPLLIWGAGRITRLRLRRLLASDLPLAGFVDLDPAKIGGTAHGLPVLAPDHLTAPGPKPFVLGAVGNRGARAEIGARLARLGYEPMVDFLPIA